MKKNLEELSNIMPWSCVLASFILFIFKILNLLEYTWWVVFAPISLILLFPALLTLLSILLLLISIILNAIINFIEHFRR